jgi:hypothetical protein
LTFFFFCSFFWNIFISTHTFYFHFFLLLYFGLFISFIFIFLQFFFPNVSSHFWNTLTLDHGKKKAKHPCGLLFFHSHQTCDCLSILALQQLVLNEQSATLMVMFFFIMEKNSPRNKMVWSDERTRGIMEWHLLSCFNLWKNVLLRLNLTIFKYLYQVLALAISRIDTNMRACVLVETRVALHFQDWEVEILFSLWWNLWGSHWYDFYYY